MIKLRERFTKWYYRKGYRMSCQPCDYGDGVAELIFHCPWWVRLFVDLFFSPSVYYREVGYKFGDDFIEGLTWDVDSSKYEDCSCKDDLEAPWLEDNDENVNTDE